MIRVTLLYPKTDDSTFDMDYYTSSHMPMFAAAIGDACTGWGVDQIVSGPYECVAWVTVESMEAFGAAMKANGGPVMADVPNYTNVQPVTAIGNVVV